MEENLQIVVGVIQAFAEVYRKFLSKSSQLRRLPFAKEVEIGMRWQTYEKNPLGLVDPPPGIIVCVDVEVDVWDRPPICWTLDVCRDEEFIYCEGRVYTSFGFDARDHEWLEINRKTNTLKQFLVDLNEVADEILKFPVPESLINGEIKE